MYCGSSDCKDLFPAHTHQYLQVSAATDWHCKSTIFTRAGDEVRVQCVAWITCTVIGAISVDADLSAVVEVWVSTLVDVCMVKREENNCGLLLAIIPTMTSVAIAIEG